MLPVFLFYFSFLIFLSYAARGLVYLGILRQILFRYCDRAELAKGATLGLKPRVRCLNL